MSAYPPEDRGDELGGAYSAWFEAGVRSGIIEAPAEDDDADLEWDDAGCPPDDELPGDEERIAAAPAGAGFADGAAFESLPPGPMLAMLTEQAAGDAGALDDDRLMGMVLQARRLQNWLLHAELSGIAEFERRRRASYEASVSRGDVRGRREGEHADRELAITLRISDDAAGKRMVLASDLTERLPQTSAGMGAGGIDWPRATIIADFTEFLDGDALAYADRVLAMAAPELTPAQLRRKAAALELRLDPQGAERRKEAAARRDRRVDAWREQSGNAALAGRELPVDEVLGAKAEIDAEAIALRKAGLDGSLNEIRAWVYLDRLNGRDPWDRLRRSGDSGGGDSVGNDGAAGSDTAAPQNWEWAEDDDYDEFGVRFGGDTGDGSATPSPAGPEARGTRPSLPALINLIVPAGVIDGASDAPAQAGSWGLLGPRDARDVVTAASRHPRTRWCVTLVDRAGRAAAHGCARGQHPWEPGTGPAPPGPLGKLLQELNVTFRPIAAGACDHAHEESGYHPSRALAHVVRARTTHCSAPSCSAQAVRCDLDHTVPYPAGKTCECDLSPACAVHHKCKHAPGWRLEQPEPGVMWWTLPSGRTRVTYPDRYDL